MLALKKTRGIYLINRLSNNAFLFFFECDHQLFPAKKNILLRSIIDYYLHARVFVDRRVIALFKLVYFMLRTLFGSFYIFNDLFTTRNIL